MVIVADVRSLPARGLKGHRWYKPTVGSEGAALASCLSAQPALCTRRRRPNPAPEAGMVCGAKRIRSLYLPWMTGVTPKLPTTTTPKGLASLSTINAATMRLCRADLPASAHSSRLPVRRSSRSRACRGTSRSRSVPPHRAKSSKRRTARSAVATGGSYIMRASGWNPGKGCQRRMSQVNNSLFFAPARAFSGLVAPFEDEPVKIQPFLVSASFLEGNVRQHPLDSRLFGHA